MVLGYSALKNEEVDQRKLVGSKAKLTEQGYKDPREGGGPEWVSPRVSKCRGFYELFCGNFVSNQGVLGCAKQGSGHKTLYLLGSCPSANGLFFFFFPSPSLGA